MSFYKSSKEEFTSSHPVARIKKIKWWFVLFILLGLLALVLVWLSQGEKATVELRKISALPSIVSIAYAQDPTANNSDKLTPRVIIMASIFMILGIVYFASIFKLFFSRNVNQIDKAADLVKTLTGFFVGAATGFLG